MPIILIPTNPLRDSRYHNGMRLSIPARQLLRLFPISILLGGIFVLQKMDKLKSSKVITPRILMEECSPRWKLAWKRSCNKPLSMLWVLILYNIFRFGKVINNRTINRNEEVFITGCRKVVFSVPRTIVSNYQVLSWNGEAFAFRQSKDHEREATMA